MSLSSKHVLSKQLYLIVCLLMLVSIGMPAVAVEKQLFVTAPGTGPDKWASVWLLRRHQNPDPILISDDPGTLSASHVLFDTAGAEYDRTGSHTTYSALLEAFTPGDKTTYALGDLVQEIEIDAWRTEVSLASQVLEQGFRGMQIVFGRQQVTQSCYMQFFDLVASAIKSGALESLSAAELQPDQSCLGGGKLDDVEDARTHVSTLPLEKLLRHIGDGDKVVFVDTREQWEFKEGHIPGAINLKLRDISQRVVNEYELSESDLVVAYCVKDFRGFEVARALRSMNVNASIISPHGMRGWVAAGLPVSGHNRLNEEEGIAAVRQLARGQLDSTVEK